MSEEILKMIEGVDPTDTDTMDEIDARTYIYINDIIILECFDYEWRNFIGKGEYTRSIDAQEAIDVNIDRFLLKKYSTGWICAIWTDMESDPHEAECLPTEALARLHCKLQVVACERNKGGKDE